MQRAAFVLKIEYWMDFLKPVVPFCLNVLFSVLKHKVTVGKDTLNIKQAVCCSEVGQVDGMANRKPEINSIIVRAFVPNNTSSVGLTGIWISFVCVVRLLTHGRLS